MNDDLHRIEAFVGGLLGKLDAAGRRAAARDIAMAVRKNQQARIARQLNPDGSAFDPRKRPAKSAGKGLRGKRGRLKRQAMFVKLRTARYLRVESNAEGFAIGYAGSVANVARVHQLGLRDRVAPRGPEYKYPARRLLGLSADDVALIHDLLLKHITN
ncbi:phage virion morphogenesis protein [Burkholderia plantarii]|uniref:phage virion morphogenesis protein n=1 Tax=Burkholderia plantarii TaxID=41899 RepID=UPI00272B58AB|nr:phage virion morphogenesis protein [Burkholderia plantarii]WLE59276.1 phage virion morphogenesis protein [Burkholderia plantarii]